MDFKNNDKRLEKGDETCGKILMSAMEVISENGVGGISATKVSALSNTSKSAIFYHFKSIQEIPPAVLQLIFTNFLQPIEARSQDNLAAFLTRIGTTFISQIGENRKMYKAFFSFYHESMFNATYKELMDDFLTVSKKNLASGIQKVSPVQISNMYAKQVAALIVAMLDGIGMHLLLGGNSDEYAAAWQFQVQSICGMIGDSSLERIV